MIEKFASILCDPRLLMDASGDVKIYYAPFEYINPSARIVLVGITPGPTQMVNANNEVRRALQSGKSSTEAIQPAKSVGAFSGEPLRSNLINQLNHWGFHKWLGLGDSADLFSTWSRPPPSCAIQCSSRTTITVAHRTHDQAPLAKEVPAGELRGGGRGTEGCPVRRARTTGPEGAGSPDSGASSELRTGDRRDAAPFPQLAPTGSITSSATEARRSRTPPILCLTTKAGERFGSASSAPDRRSGESMRTRVQFRERESN